MKIRISIIALLMMAAVYSNGQSDYLGVHFEFQAYPTGLIPGIRVEKGFAGKNAVHFRLGYQIIDHRDLGKQDDETGNGYGFTLGYKRYFGADFKGFHAGVRNDIWFNEIDWKDGLDTPEPTSGTTDILVVQPTAEAGYTWLMGNNWAFTPTVAFGFEVNVKTEGEPTGEGAILLLGIQFGKRF